MAADRTLLSPERTAARQSARRGLAIGLPPLLTMTVLFVIPLGIVAMYSFATRGRTGRTVLADWNLAGYQRLAEPLVLQVVGRSLAYAGYPFAYWLTTLPTRRRAILLVLVMLPFWSNLLVRTYAWRVLLASDGPIVTALATLGLDEVRLLFTPFAVILGLVYGYLPFMVLPLYATLDRLDIRLVEAARDLGANGWEAFRTVTWPLSRPGVVAGSVLVMVPTFGAYVTPELLGGSRTTLVGSFVVRQFLSARDWPFGSALSIAILLLMTLATAVHFRMQERRA